MKKRIAVALVALVMIVGCVVGGTLAWLTDTTNEVTNTFTHGDIDIELTETPADYKMIPGTTIAKDPKVTVKAGSEACWLFVEIVESENFDTFMTYAIANGWILYPNTTESTIDTAENDNYVIYRKVDAVNADTSYDILAGNIVTVPYTVTKTMLDGITTDPTLTFTAYAVQSEAIDLVTDAWYVAKNPANQLPSVSTQG